MAPNKFEKYIKEQLRDQEIKPSERAWERISTQLEAHRRPKRNYYVRYGIAATLLGILLVSLWYFRRAEVVVPASQVVSKASEKENDLKNEGQADVPFVDKAVEAQTKTEKRVEHSIKQEKPIIQDKTERKGMAITEGKPRSQEKVRIVNDIPESLSEDLIHTKITEIVAHVDNLESENTSVSEAEIDALLRKAQQELLKEKIFRKDNSVDAAALLADVEQEIDRSFRDQIFDALKDGYIKVRTAVADRNK